MNINGVELEFNIYDADTMEKVTDSVNKVQKELTSVGKIKDEANQIRSMCKSIKRFIDEVLGAGIGVELCGEANNLLKHIDMYECIIEEITQQRKDFENRMKKLAGKYNIQK